MVRMTLPRWFIILLFARLCVVDLPLSADEKATEGNPNPPSNATEEFQSVRGIVTSIDGSPISNAKIVLGQIKRIPILATTDEAGKFEAKNIPKSRTNLYPTVSHPEFVSLGSFECKLDKSGVTEVSWKMEKGAAIRGRVTAKEDGRPLKDITIIEGRSRFGSNRVEPKVKTDANGNFELGSIRPGSCVINAFSPDFAPAMKEVAVDVEHPAEVEFQLEKGRDVTGRVTDPSGKPVPKAWIITDTWNGVRMFRRETHTDKDGNYKLRQMPSTPTIVNVILKDYVSVRDLQVKGGDEKNITLSPVTPYFIKLRLADTDRVPEKPTVQEGYVFQGRTEIEWRNQMYPASYDAKTGIFTIREDEPFYGEKAFRFRVDGYQDAVFDLPETPPASTSIELTLQRAKVTTGHVVDADDGKPLEGVTVALADNSDRMALSHYVDFKNIPKALKEFTGTFAVTTKDGRFELPAIDAATDKTLILIKPDVSFFVVGPAKDFAGFNSFDIPFPKGGVIECSISTAGVPQPEEDVSLSYFQSQRRLNPTFTPFSFGGKSSTGVDGTYRFVGLGPGRYHLQQVKSFNEQGGGTSYSLSDAPQEILIRPGQTATVKFSRPEGKTIRGKVLEGNDKPSGNCIVMLQQSTPFEPLRRLDVVRAGTNGEFIFAHVAPGDYQVVAQHYTRSGSGAMCGLGNNDRSGQSNVTIKEDATVVVKLKPESTSERLKETKIKGAICPQFAGNLLDGNKSIKLSDLNGKVVVIDFWATWCGPCMAVMPEMKQIYEKYKDHKDVVFITVSLDEDESQLRKVIKVKGLPFPVLYSGDGWKDSMAQALGVHGIPSSYVIAPSGRFASERVHGSQLGQTIEAVLHDAGLSGSEETSPSRRVVIKTTLDGEPIGLAGASIDLRVLDKDGKAIHEESIPVVGTGNEFVYSDIPQGDGSRIVLAGVANGVRTKELEVALDKEVVEATVAFECPRILSGRVTKGEENAEVAGLVVEARRTDNFARTVTTDAEGRFSMRVLPGDYLVSFNQKNQTTIIGTTKREFKTVLADRDLTELELRACTVTSLEGEVVDQDNNPVNDAWIQLISNWSKKPIKTDANGHFKISDVPSHGALAVRAGKDQLMGGIEIADRGVPPRIVLSKSKFADGLRAGQMVPKLPVTQLIDQKETNWKPLAERNNLVLFCPLWHPRSKEWISSARSWADSQDTSLVIVSIDPSAEVCQKWTKTLGLDQTVNFIDPYGLHAASEWSLNSPGQSYLVSPAGMILAIQEPGRFDSPPAKAQANGEAF
ncbi:carboxypeptidase regulatory-like domain-containing protein [bacterium]|nr:carboxypeptidase regulatory-like domain-containing protein [bacterium]